MVGKGTREVEVMGLNSGNGGKNIFLFLFIIKILFKSYPLAVKGVPLLLVRITN